MSTLDAEAPNTVEEAPKQQHIAEPIGEPDDGVDYWMEDVDEAWRRARGALTILDDGVNHSSSLGGDVIDSHVAPAAEIVRDAVGRLRELYERLDMARITPRASKSSARGSGPDGDPDGDNGEHLDSADEPSESVPDKPECQKAWPGLLYTVCIELERIGTLVDSLRALCEDNGELREPNDLGSPEPDMLMIHSMVRTVQEDLERVRAWLKEIAHDLTEAEKRKDGR